MTTNAPATIDFLTELGRCTEGEDAPHRVQRFLEENLPKGIGLPERFFATDESGYARHLLAQYDSGATAIVMVWGIGQGTPVHDHAGMWCVEGVVRGQIKVTQYLMTEDKGEDVRFRQEEQIQANIGDSGALIPPVDHHTIFNNLDTEPSVTLHIYAGDMTECEVFLPVEDDLYRREVKPLIYTSEDPLVG